MTAATPTLAIPAPAGWTASEVLELTAPELGAHVVASAEPLRPGTSVEELTRAYGRLLEQTLPEYEDLGLEQLAGHPARPSWLRRLAWTPPGGRRVTQLQLYAVDGNQAYIATATAQTDRFAVLEGRLRAVLASIVSERPSGPALPAVEDGSAGDEERLAPVAKLGESDTVEGRR